MDPVDLAKLQNATNDLRSELIFDHICTALLQDELINREEYQRISNAPSDAQKVDILLTVLPHKGPDSFNKFVSILDTDYPWLARKLRYSTAPVHLQDRNRGTNILKLDQVVTPKMMKMVRSNYRVVRGWTRLAHTLGLTRFVHKIKCRVNVQDEDAEMCVMYLLEEWLELMSKKATLGALLEALREESFNDCADELEDSFAQ